MPMLVHEYKLSAKAPAPGKYRGGLGIDFSFQVFTPNAIVTARGMERFQFRPWGRKGGGAGTLCETLINPHTPQERSVGKVTSALHPEPGDVVAINTPGGGGFGDPYEREPAKVLKDVSEDLLSIETARRDYGVVITADLKVDEKATAALRGDRPAPKKAAEFTYGPERDAYEAAFPPQVQDALAKALLSVPSSQRQFYKTRVWAKVTDNGKARTATAKPEDMATLLEQCRKEVTQIVV
jgi:N-methylhydantoinase B